MISRGTALAVANAYTSKFSSRSSGYRGERKETVFRDHLYEFLYERDYEAWFCNAARANFSIRGLKDWFLKLHTGESLASATPNWPWEKRAALGQRNMRDLAEDFLVWHSSVNDEWTVKAYAEVVSELSRRLEIDGYLFREGALVQVEAEVLDLDQEKGLLAKIYEAVGLNRKNEAFEFLRISEEHYVSGHWADSISNCRKFLELTLSEGACAYAKVKGDAFSEADASRPVEVRNYLERSGLVEKKERESLDKIYGLLSHTGSHPYMAEKDQARLLRQLSMTISQFVLLRLEGALKR